MNDRDVVDAFVAYLAGHGFPGLQVDRRPDEDNRGSQDIDAIAGPFAIEHTSIDTLPNQRRASNWFMRAVGDIGLEIGLPFRLTITIDYDAVTSGQDWDLIRSALITWLLGSAPGLADGRHVVEVSPDIPFRLHVSKSSSRRSGLFFYRFAPADDTLPARVRASFERKSAKLVRYQAPGVVTVLLVENGDIALMDEAALLESIRAAFPLGRPHGVDQVWFADTSIVNAPEFRDFTPELGGAAV